MLLDLWIAMHLGAFVLAIRKQIERKKGWDPSSILLKDTTLMTGRLPTSEQIFEQGDSQYLNYVTHLLNYLDIALLYF